MDYSSFQTVGPLYTYNANNNQYLLSELKNKNGNNYGCVCNITHPATPTIMSCDTFQKFLNTFDPDIVHPDCDNEQIKKFQDTFEKSQN